MIRRVDVGLACGHLFLAGTAFTTDVWAWTGRIHGDDLLARGLAGYAKADPLFGIMPAWLQAIMLLSTFVFGPMNVLLAVGLLRRARFTPELALVSAGAQAVASWTYLLADALGDTPPTSWAVVLAMNVPYSALPIATAVSTRSRAEGFWRDGRKEAGTSVEPHARS